MARQLRPPPPSQLLPLPPALLRCLRPRLLPALRAPIPLLTLNGVAPAAPVAPAALVTPVTGALGLEMTALARGARVATVPAVGARVPMAPAPGDGVAGGPAPGDRAARTSALGRIFRRSFVLSIFRRHEGAALDRNVAPPCASRRGADFFLTHCGYGFYRAHSFVGCRHAFFEENFWRRIDSPPGPKSERRASSTPFVRRLTSGASATSMDTANAISSRGHSNTLATGSYDLHTLQTDGSHIVRPTSGRSRITIVPQHHCSASHT